MDKTAIRKGQNLRMRGRDVGVGDHINGHEITRIEHGAGIANRKQLTFWLADASPIYLTTSMMTSIFRPLH